MQGTRRYWASVGLTGLLAAAAIVLAQPLLVAGAAGLGTWLLAQQCLFVWTAHRLHDDLQISQTVDRPNVAVDESVTVSVTVARATGRPRPVTVTVTAGVPLSATGAGQTARECTLTSTDQTAATTFTVQWPVASQADFTAPTVTVTDAHGLFETSFADTAPGSPTVTVRSQQPRALHIGAGGDPTQSALGSHPGDQQASGLEPATVREYTPGDPLRQIDWNATARSTRLYIRQFTPRMDHETAIVLDHRAAMGTGTPGETKLAYAREVALAVVDQAQTDGDPIGVYTVGDSGVTAHRPPTSSGEAYSNVRTVLHDLTPTQPSDTPTAATDTSASPSSPMSASANGGGLTPQAARQAAATLEADHSPFAASLRPFFDARQTYVQRVATDPLYAAVQAYLTPGGGTSRHIPDRTVILTDATKQAEVREAVNVARRHSDHVIVFLTPTVLFEPGGLSDIDQAYARYTDFETFRQTLMGIDGVSAFEVAPRDRLATLRTAIPTSIPSR